MTRAHAPLFFFAFGSFPELSLAEGAQVVGRGEQGARVVWANQQGAMLEGMQHEEAIELFYRLGGSVKVASVGLANDPVSAALELLIDEHTQRPDTCLIFGLSVYNGHASPYTALERAKRLGLGYKRKLQGQGIASRFVTSRSNPLSAVVVEKNRLLDRGVEIVVVHALGQWYVGRTLAVQAFEQWQLRDIDRPRRNAKRGMLPPKVARMMINLAAQSQKRLAFSVEGLGNVKNLNAQPSALDPIILDPFCGSGTILMEAFQLGYSVIGSDISNEAVEDTRKNLEWLQRKGIGYRVQGLGIDYTLNAQSYTLIVSDVRTLTQKLPPHSIDAIVTEPDLGPPQTKRIEKEIEIESVRRRLHRLYLESLSQFSKLLKPGGRVVMSLPAWRIREQGTRSKEQSCEKLLYGFDHLGVIERAGLHLVQPPSRQWSNVKGQKMSSNERSSLLYGRPDQFVWREIVILE